MGHVNKSNSRTSHGQSNSAKGAADSDFAPKSSYIEAIEFDGKQKKLTVSFKNGTIVSYSDVSSTLYESFRSAENHGVYYSHLIKGKLNGTILKPAAIGKKTKIQREVEPHVKRSPGNRIKPVPIFFGTVARSGL